jgi:hypothetical protein
MLSDIATCLIFAFCDSEEKANRLSSTNIIFLLPAATLVSALRVTKLDCVKDCLK